MAKRVSGSYASGIEGYTIEVWFDRNTRSYIAQLVERAGTNQVGHAEYSGNVRDAEASISFLRYKAPEMVAEYTSWDGFVAGVTGVPTPLTRRPEVS